MSNTFEQFRKNLVEKIKEQKISNSKFASLLGVDRSYVHQLIKGKRRFNEEIIEKLSIILNVPIVELFEEKSEKSSSFSLKKYLLQNIPEYRNAMLTFHRLSLETFSEEINAFFIKQYEKDGKVDDAYQVLIKEIKELDHKEIIPEENALRVIKTIESHQILLNIKKRFDSLKLPKRI